jgi:hypothetical protein
MPIKKKGDRHRPGYYREYRAPSREGKRGVVSLLSEAEFDAFTQRVREDGISKREAGRTALLHYIKHGL